MTWEEDGGGVKWWVYKKKDAVTYVKTRLVRRIDELLMRCILRSSIVTCLLLLLYMMLLLYEVSLMMLILGGLHCHHCGRGIRPRIDSMIVLRSISIVH